MIIAINAISAKKGGMLTYTLSLIDYLIKLKGNDVFHIWVPLNLPRNSSEKVVLHKTKATYYSPLKRLLYDQIILRNEVKKIKADVLFSSAGMGLIFSPCKQLLLIRNNIYYNKYYRKEIYSKFGPIQKINYLLHMYLIYFSARRTDALIFPSFTMKKSFLSFYVSGFPNAYVNYYGISNNKFNNHKNTILNTNTSIKLLYISKYYPHKRPEIILRAYEILKEKKYNVKIRMTMEFYELKNYLDSSDLITITGNKNITLCAISPDENQELYFKNDIFIFPSLCESFGFPLIEAMASEIPIIAADTEINREICGKAALYFEPDNEFELVENILLINNNMRTRNGLIQESVKRINKYLVGKHINKIIDICKEMI